MTVLPIQAYFALCFAIYAIGIYTLIAKRNVLRMILAIELMLAAANMTFVVVSYWFSPGVIDPLVRSIVIISMAVGSIVAALAVSLTILVYRVFKTRDVRKLSKLKW
ncbi:MAG: NADH-quinone oxidoreductase subunit NuoK [Candidatus Njordarchaeales archaeon]